MVQMEDQHLRAGRSLRRQSVQKRGSTVRRAVIDGDDLEGARVVLSHQRAESRRDLLFFVTGGNHDRKRRSILVWRKGRLIL
jgi:hypothetical protein